MDKKQKNDKLRQHYVPKFYLRNFSENNKSIGLYRFKEKKIIKQGSIRDILQKKYYYGKNPYVENKLANYEGKWSDIISYIIETESLPIDAKNLILLRYFILISSARTQKRGDEINKYYTSLMKKLLEIADPEFFESLKIAENDRFSMRMEFPSLSFIDAAGQILPLVIDLKLELLINKSNIDYVTSDNPTVFYNQLFQFKNLSRGFGWGEYGIQFIIPISPKIAICMYDGKVYNLRKRIFNSSKQINKLNELFLNNSDELIVFMYGEDDKVKEEKLSYINRLVKKRRQVSVKNEDSNLINFSNKQVVGKYDLSDIFKIKKKYKDMIISKHNKDEIEKKVNTEVEKLVAKMQSMPEDELKILLENKKSELISIVFNDMERPWVKFYNIHQSKIIDMFMNRAENNN